MSSTQARPVFSRHEHITVPELADIVGISRQRLAQLASKGAGPRFAAHSTGKHNTSHVRIEDALRWVQERAHVLTYMKPDDAARYAAAARVLAASLKIAEQIEAKRIEKEARSLAAAQSKQQPEHESGNAQC